MARPSIGICTPLARARWGAWDMDAFVLPRSYPDALHRAGALVLMLVPDAAHAADPDELLDRLDGLMLAGDDDLDPAYDAAAQQPAIAPGTLPARDAFELALARRALERDLPLLAVGRGMQVMNVALGGTPHRHHRHGVDRIGDGLVVSARSQADGLAAALELPANRFARALRCHPEAGERDGLVGALVDAVAPIGDRAA